MIISLTKQETESRRMSPRRLKQAVEAIRRDGYVVIEKAFPDDCGLNHNAEFIEEPIDYLLLNRSGS